MIASEDIRTPEDFRRKLKQLYRRERRDLLKHLGSPPDVRNIPATAWKQIRKDEQAMMLLLMAGFGAFWLDDWNNRIADETGQQVNQGQVERRFMSLSRQRANFSASRIVRTTKSRIRKKLNRYRDENGKPPTKAAASEILGEVFDDSRSETVTRTEMTAARSAAAMASHHGANSLGLDAHCLWVMRPCNHCTTCPTFHRTDQPFWSQFSAGPPLHPNCCCSLDIVYGEREVLVSKGVIHEGRRQEVLAAMAKDRIEVPRILLPR